jgi:hypothetical protein
VTICGSQLCSCGLVSNSLTVTGSGAPGSPFQIETNMGQIVTSGTRPGSPINGQGIYETDTQRLLVYDGTNWVIVAGDMPRFKVEHQTAQSIADLGGGGTAVVMSTEIYDIGGFHTGSNPSITVPAGMGGDYLLVTGGSWVASAAGYRLISMNVTNNAGAPVQNTTRRGGGSAMINTANNGQAAVMEYRLAAAAVVTVIVAQNSGGALNLNSISLEGQMIRHLPALV